LSYQRLGSLAVAASAVLLFSGCAQSVKVASDWHGEHSGLPAEKALVIAVTPDLNSRRRFEDLVAQRVTGDQTRAWSSSRKMDTQAPLRRETVQEAVDETGAQLVIVTRLVNADLDVREAGEPGSIRARRRYATPLDFFRYDYEITERDIYLVPTASVSLSTDVYDVRSGKLLYSLDTVIPPRETRLEIMSAAARAIADRLRRDGLIR